MADNIELGLDLKDTTVKTGELASGLTRVKEAAKGVADAYDLVAAAESKTSGSGGSVFGDLSGVGLKPIQEATRATTEFQDALARASAVMKRVGADEETFLVAVPNKVVQAVEAEIGALDRSAAAAERAGASHRSAAAGIEAMGSSAQKSSDRMQALSRGALQTSQAMQDVAQGGWASGLNNVDGVVYSLGRGLGISATAAAGLSAGLLGVGTAALVVGPQIKAWYDSIEQGDTVLGKLSETLVESTKGFQEASLGAKVVYAAMGPLGVLLGPSLANWYSGVRDLREAIPGVTDETVKLSAAIKENAAWMKEAAEKGYLTGAELDEYNKRLMENARLERDLVEAKQAKVNTEKLAALQTKEAVADAKKAADTLQDELTGKTGDVIQSLTVQMTRKSEELANVEAAFQAAGRAYDAAVESGDRKAGAAALRRVTELGETRTQTQAAIAARAANAVADAVLKGDEDAIKKIAETLSGSQSQYAKLFEAQAKSFAESALDRKAWEEVTKEYVETAAKKIKEAGGKVKEAASNLVPEDVADAAVDKIKKAGEKVAAELKKLGPEDFAKDAEATAMAVKGRIDAIVDGVEAGVQGVEKKADEAQKRIYAALAKTAPDPFEGVNSFEDLATKFDDQGNRVESPDEFQDRMMEELDLAGVRRRSAIRKPLKRTAYNEGFDLDEGQLSTAAGMAEQGMMSGMSRTEAIMSALMELQQQMIANQRMLADHGNQYAGRIDSMRQGASQVRSILNPNGL